MMRFCGISRNLVEIRSFVDWNEFWANDERDLNENLNIFEDFNMNFRKLSEIEFNLIRFLVSSSVF